MILRKFIEFLGGAAVWPVTAYAQRTPRPVIGFLGSESPARFASQLRAFHEGLSETGFIEGQNVSVEYRGRPRRFRSR